MMTSARSATAGLLVLGTALMLASPLAADEPAVGVRGEVGPQGDARRVQRLQITRPGVYENYLVDGEWVESNLVKVNADDVTLRHCEIRHGRHNGVTVYASDVVIDSCRIHHLLKGTFDKQADAHGITGRPRKLMIRNCEIYLVSGDAVQFDPGRGAWGEVLIENCTFWTAPLDADAAGFKKGERPGENGVDTKSSEEHPRPHMTIRNCLCHGWGDGQISNMAALNLKDHVEVTVENCVFRDNEICLRLRGDTGERGGAKVTVRDCALYRSDLGLRLEDRIAGLTIERLGFGEGVRRKYQFVGEPGPDYTNRGEFAAPPFEQAVCDGLAAKR